MPTELREEIRRQAWPPGLKSAGRPTWAIVRALLADLDAALERERRLREGLGKMHLMAALAWDAIRAGRDLMDSSDDRFAEWCEGVDMTLPEWEAEARALLTPAKEESAKPHGRHYSQTDC